MSNTEFFTLIYLILSTMIGAGILALPSVFYSVGILPSLILLLISGFVVYIASLILLKASLKCYKNTLPEIFKRYFGKKMKMFSIILICLTLFFVCIAYLNVINFSLKTFIKESETYTLLIAALSMSTAFIGFSLIEKTEKILFSFKMIFLILFLFFVIFVPKKYKIELITINFENFFQFILISIFAFSFYSVIPSLLYITRDENILRKSFIYSIFLAFIIYYFFSLIISSRTGNLEISTLGFNELFNFLTILFIITPYLIISWVLSEIIIEETKLDKNISLLFSFGVPLIFFILLPKVFIYYLEIASAFFILSTYFLIGMIGFRYSRELRINKLLSSIILLFSLFLIFFEILDLFLL